MSLHDLISYCAAEPVAIAGPTFLIRINRKFRHNMSPLDLYEVTRGIWKLRRRRERAAYAMAVFGGIVKEVFGIQS